MTAHNHRTHVAGCVRCDLSQDEVRAAWKVGDRCHAPKDPRVLIIVGFLGNAGTKTFEAELVSATGPAGPRRFCAIRFLRPVEVS